MRRLSLMKLLRACAVGAGAFIAGCGGGAGPTAAAATAKAQISLGDAAGDFYSYTVDVTSVKLRRDNGELVEMLPARTRIDFAEFVNVAELVSSKDVPPGRYTGAQLVLDYSNAQIVVEAADGSAVAATPQDTAGNPLTTLTADVQVPGADGFTLSAGEPGHVMLDFDLAASNTVSFPPSGAPTVRVSPVLVADAHPADGDRPRHAQGVLTALDAAGKTLTIDLRPFDHHDSGFGSITATVGDATVYEVDGHNYTGAAGLAALAALVLPVPVAVLGQVDPATQTLAAQQVIAGSGEDRDHHDGLRGHVIARSGNVVTVLGAVADQGDDHASFGRSIALDISNATVTRDDGASGLDISAVSIGQAIEAVGANDSGAPQNSKSGDTEPNHFTASSVRLLSTVATASVVSLSPLVVSLQDMDGIPVEHLDFTGAGGEGTVDPNNYRVDSGTLTLDGVAIGNIIRMAGYPGAFANVPPDFSAVSITNVDSSAGDSGLHAVWSPPGSSTPFSAESNDGVVIDRSSTQMERSSVIRQGDSHLVLKDLPHDVSLLPGGDGSVYVLVTGYDEHAGDAHSETQYASFSEFRAALDQAGAGGARLRGIEARGSYHADGYTFTATHLMAAVSKPAAQ